MGDIWSIITRKPMIDKHRCETCAFNVGNNSNDSELIYCDYYGFKHKNNNCERYEWELWRLQSWKYGQE